MDEPPRTQLIIPLLSRQKRDEWPLIPDTNRVAFAEVKVGSIVTYRTWRGPKSRRVRIISRTWRRNRRFFVGDTRKGWCAPILFERIISVQ